MVLLNPADGECSPGEDGGRTEELAELNRRLQNEHKEVRDGVMGEGHDLSEEDESGINDGVGDLNGHPEAGIGAAASLKKQPPPPTLPPQQQQQNPQGPLVRWERFLPLGSLKVLLVEDDDSTRQVVSALLRNCSYDGEK